MKYELSQEFYFEAAHTLSREVEADSSRRVHGHTYHAQISIEGPKDAHTGMVADLGHVRQIIENVRSELDHRLLDEVQDLGSPTLENLCSLLWRRFHAALPALSRVTVSRRASGDACTLTK
jgi:6-pyruvoyltetrahydropterin/6-carboxytetrahydropterin synthase